MNCNNLIDYHLAINDLKQTKRYTAAAHFKGDTSASHSWQLALLAIDVIELFDLDLNILHALKIALVHDLSEYKMQQDFDYLDIKNGKKLKEDKIKGELGINTFSRDGH